MLRAAKKSRSVEARESRYSVGVDLLGKERSIIASVRRLPWRFLRSVEKRTVDRLSPKLQWFAKLYVYGKKRRLIAVSKYAEMGNFQKIVVAGAKVTEITEPQFVGFSPDIDPTPRRLIEPEVAILEYENSSVLAGTDFVFQGRYCIHSDLFVPRRDFPMVENFGEARIFPDSGVIVSGIFEPPARMEAAISLLGQCAGSYAHFMSEVLPKLLIIDERSEYDGIPVLVDAWIDPALVQILECFNLKRRKILRVVFRRPVLAKRLITVSPTSYTPPELRDIIEGRPKPKLAPDIHKFSTFALSLVRRAGRQVSPNPASWVGEKLYIRRSASMNGRVIVNDANIEACVQRAGFSVIDPVTLTIQEQIAAFRNAKVVIAPVGGSLVNTLFAEPGCKIICLSAFFKNAEYDYHAQMQKALGHEVRFVVGPQLPNQTVHIMHRNYRISMDDLMDAIRLMS